MIEDDLKAYIKLKYRTIRNFCINSGFSYSTIDNMLKRGISGSSVSNVIKLCDKLNIDVDALSEGEIISKDRMIKYLSDHEKEVINAYRQHEELQPAVDKLLDVK